MRHLILASILFFALGAPLSYAAEIVLVSSHAPEAGKKIEVTLMLDTEGAALNAIEGTFEYPSGLRLTEIHDGNSIVNFWIERPKEAAGTIPFAGIMPGGYSGAEGEILTLIFDVLETGDVMFGLRNSRAFLNDGNGTPVRFALRPGVNIEDGVGAPYENDVIPPETFTLTQTTSQDLFEGRPFLVFATQDKQSGIERYEIAEKSGIRYVGVMRRFLSFKPAESPHVRENPNAYAYVKAIDRAGNERISVLSPATPRSHNMLLVAVGILILLAGLFARYVLRHKK